MKKKLLMLTLVSFFSIGFYGCDSADAATQPTETTTEAAKTTEAEKSAETSAQATQEIPDVTDEELKPFKEIYEMTEDKLPQLNLKTEGRQVATIKTNMGDMKILLFGDIAPKTVENFVTHAKNGYYNGISFHRVMNDFMIQGGDPQGNGMGGESIWGEAFEDEFSPYLYNLRGALSMANSGANTNGSQFFIVQNKNLNPEYAGMFKYMEESSDSKDTRYFEANFSTYYYQNPEAPMGVPKLIMDKYTTEGGTPHLDQKHTVFGQMIEGYDILDKIAAVEVDADDKPVEEVIINGIDIQ